MASRRGGGWGANGGDEIRPLSSFPVKKLDAISRVNDPAPIPRAIDVSLLSTGESLFHESERGAWLYLGSIDSITYRSRSRYLSDKEEFLENREVNARNYLDRSFGGVERFFQHLDVKRAFPVPIKIRARGNNTRDRAGGRGGEVGR